VGALLLYPKGNPMINRPKGQGLVEYAVILALVAVVVTVILLLGGPGVGNVFSNILIGL
jgi:pilus assembly protein Flp/PilA